MKKSANELAVGDWVLVEGLLIDRPARDPAQSGQYLELHDRLSTEK